MTNDVFVNVDQDLNGLINELDEKYIQSSGRHGFKVSTTGQAGEVHVTRAPLFQPAPTCILRTDMTPPMFEVE